jgi:hypothetical protein
LAIDCKDYSAETVGIDARRVLTTLIEHRNRQKKERKQAKATEARAKATEARAEEQAIRVGDVVFEGQQPRFMGRYELVKPLKMVNRRAVWQAVGRKNEYVFVGSDGSWWISDVESMSVGENSGWVASAVAEPDALTPNQVQGGWKVDDDRALVAAPSVSVRQWAAENETLLNEEIRLCLAAAALAPNARGADFDGLCKTISPQARDVIDTMIQTIMCGKK